MTTIVDGTTGITFPSTISGVSATQQYSGRILQVINGTTSTQASTTSGTYADTPLNATITPTSSTSKILVFVDMVDCANSFSNGALLGLRLVRGSTALLTFSGYGGYYNLATATIDFGTCSTNYLDSPATTSATTYKVQLVNFNAGGTMYTNYTSGSTSTMTLMEIAA